MLFLFPLLQFWVRMIVIILQVFFLAKCALCCIFGEQLACTGSWFALLKMIVHDFLVGPKWFRSDQIDLDLTIMIWSRQNEMVTTRMNWSGPNCGFLPITIIFWPNQFILVMTISFWLWPKPFWTDQNCFGHIEGQDIGTYNFWCWMS